MTWEEIKWQEMFILMKQNRGILMPLINFGSILNFAEEIESQDFGFYQAAGGNPTCVELKALFEQFEKDAKKNIQNAQRTRRENVTEMILEGIEGFFRAPFVEKSDGGDTLDAAAVMEIAKKLEDRAIRYYREAAEKMKALPEVSRALKTMGKKRAAHLKKIEALDT